jgi:type II secretory pathway pseudopilin PulG
MKRSKAFTLIELVLAITILLGIIGAIVINYDSLVGNTRYFEARENLKTYLINLKYQ